MQAELIRLWFEFDELVILFSGVTALLLIISWPLIHKRAGRTMTQRRYSATVMALGAAIASMFLLFPLGIMAVNHPGLFTAFVGFLIVEFPHYFVNSLFYVLMVVMLGWYYARSYPVGEKHESQSEPDPEPIDRPVGP